MTTWGIQGAMVFVFFFKEKSGHARKNIYSDELIQSTF